jgi:cell division protease FtsH
MQTRDYSDVTAREIDEEMHRILVFHESRCRDLLTKNRSALNLVARALLEHETISGQEVERLVALAAQPASTGSDEPLPVESSPVD